MWQYNYNHDYLAHGSKKSYKYIDKVMGKNGKWRYIYNVKSNFKKGLSDGQRGTDAAAMRKDAFERGFRNYSAANQATGQKKEYYTKMGNQLNNAVKMYDSASYKAGHAVGNMGRAISGNPKANTINPKKGVDINLGGGLTAHVNEATLGSQKGLKTFRMADKPSTNTTKPAARKKTYGSSTAGVPKKKKSSNVQGWLKKKLK